MHGVKLFQNIAHHPFWCLLKEVQLPNLALWKRIQVKQTSYVKKQTKLSIFTTPFLIQVATTLCKNLKRLLSKQEKWKVQ